MIHVLWEVFDRLLRVVLDWQHDDGTHVVLLSASLVTRALAAVVFGGVGAVFLSLWALFFAFQV